MKRWAIPIGTFIAVLGLTGALITILGVMPIKASSGHWAITEWFLRFSKSRSISTHSAGITVPDNLGDNARAMKGAGHFETGCAPCHGSPVWKKPRIAQRLTPTPPHLPDKVPDRTDAEMFYLVKHGIKFTGMPAFPSLQRDDEVWDMVAFLRRLPELDESGYRELVFGVDSSAAHAPDDAPHAVVDSCARCHGSGGESRGTSAFPRLAGLHREYFIATMRAYADGDRHSGMMEPVAARLTDEEIHEIANWYTGRTQPNSVSEADGTNSGDLDSDDSDSGDSNSGDDAAGPIERGRLIAQNGLPDQNVGACIACHSTSRQNHNLNYPSLPGQFADYLALQLELFQRRRRGGTDSASLMHSIVDNLSPDDIRDVAAYYASLGL